jgi:hypothetical protein
MNSLKHLRHIRQLRQLSHWFALLRGEPTEAEVHSSQLLASLLTMAWFVEARDPYTGGHLWRVARYARLLAEGAGFSDGDAARIGLGGFLHDLGKVGVPDAVLRKPGPLTEEEYAIIKTHPDIGARMIAAHPLAELVNDAVLSHHERPDGQGYPCKLAGDAISDMAYIVGICDAFDAMTSHRPYRPGMSRNKALAIISEGRGTQFEIRFAGIFMTIGTAGKLDHVMGHSDDGIPLRCCPMCGPTLVVLREQTIGDRIYCRNCTSEFTLVEKDGSLIAIPTGQKGSAADLEPKADAALIVRMVQAIAAAMPISAMVGDSEVPTRSAASWH